MAEKSLFEVRHPVGNIPTRRASPEGKTRNKTRKAATAAGRRQSRCHRIQPFGLCRCTLPVGGL